jgi:hypothetical protein
MRAAGAWDNDPRRSARGGPLVPPGRYQVRLTAGATVEMRPLDIKVDPRLAADGITAAHLQEQYDFSMRLVAAITRARQLGAKVRGARDELARRTSGDEKSATRLESVRALDARITTAPGTYPQPMLIDQLQNVLRMTSQADQRLGRDALERFSDLEKELAAAEAEFGRIATESEKR